MKGLRSPIGMGRAARCWTGVAASSIFSLLCVAAASASAFADLKLPPRRSGDPPMRIFRVMSSDSSCGSNCPEWISAEGRIMVGTAKTLAELVNGLSGRRLPVLIHSRGGSVADAIAMGRLIRAKHLAVAVARTLIPNCAERARICPGARGQAITGGAVCASACPLVLAGGVERLVSAVPKVGVHQITTVLREVEGEAHLTTTKKLYEQGWIDSEVKDYLAEMGVGDPVMALMRKTPAASIHWLSGADLLDSRLATQRLDSAAPILADGANGLNGHALEGDPPQPDLLTANVVAPSAQPAQRPRSGAGRDLRLQARRRGGRSDDRNPRRRHEAGGNAAGCRAETDGDAGRR